MWVRLIGYAVIGTFLCLGVGLWVIPLEQTLGPLPGHVRVIGACALFALFVGVHHGFLGRR